ncbi:MAG: stage III sporulation protein AB [Clostridia bacterium]|nr:stage III sporulation protein AB [Clostridia bacterium]
MSVIFAVRQIKRHTNAIRQCLLMIENIEIYLAYNNMTISEVFRILDKSCLYNELCFIPTILSNDKNGSFETILNVTTLCRIDSSIIFDANDKEYIKGFLSMLGKSDINGQILNCKMYKDIFKKKLKILEDKEQESCKSISTIILGFGILLAIIII